MTWARTMSAMNTQWRSARALRKMTRFGQKLDTSSWCRHEHRALKELHEAGADVPRPIAVSDNAILMELIGDAEFPAPILTAVRGQCLGGGLEIALAGGSIYAAPDAQFGQPEIRLGVFAPAASCLLPWRISAVAAEDLLCSGRSIGAAQAHAIGLVHTLADDPEAAALAYFDEHLAPRSAAALACAMSAARAARVRELRERLTEVERIYLQQLMKTHDANEGLAAFLAKRAPAWQHR